MVTFGRHIKSNNQYKRHSYTIIMKTIVTKLLQGIKSIRPVISFDQYGATSIAFELDKKIRLNNEEIEARINQLDDVKKSLIMAADAIQLISEESKQKKIELDELRSRLAEINRDKETIEKVLQIDQDSFSRLLISTNKKTEKRSILIGIVIGFLTGTLSSFLVWILTK
jgi:hypothetical protein